MSFEIGATYEDGVLKPDNPLPLAEHERVTVHIEPHVGSIRQTSGLVAFNGDPETLKYLLGPDNQPWEEQ